MREANERSMKTAENQMVQIKEAMTAITQQQSAPPTLAQPVIPPPSTWAQPPVRQKSIAPPVEPIPLKIMVNGFGATWRMCIHCKKMYTHATDD